MEQERLVIVSTFIMTLRKLNYLCVLLTIEKNISKCTKEPKFKTFLQKSKKPFANNSIITSMTPNIIYTIITMQIIAMQKMSVNAQTCLKLAQCRNFWYRLSYYTVK